MLILTGSDRTLRQRKIKVEVEDEDSSSYMSLDVLAQVASATLEKEPTGNKPKSPAKRVNISNLFLLTRNSCENHIKCYCYQYLKNQMFQLISLSVIELIDA